MDKLTVYKRAFKDLFILGKKFYILFFTQSLARFSLPFIGFIYMTLIVDALTRNNMSDIPNLVVQYLSILLILQLIAGWLEPLVNNEDSLLLRKLFAEPNKKMLTMHYHYAESSEVREKLEIINRNMMSTQSSLHIINVRIKEMTRGVVSIVWGIILLSPLFSINTNLLPDGFWWLHPALIISLFLFLIGISVWIQINSSKKSGESLLTFFAELKESNAIFFYENGILQDFKSGKEMRLYNLTEKMIKNLEDDSVHTRKLLAKNYKYFRALTLPTTGLFQVMTYFTYAYIGILVLLGALPIALIIQLSSALSQMVSALPDVIQHGMMMISSPDELEEYYEFMDLPDEEVVGSLPVEKRLDNEYTFDIKDLSFAYPGSEELVLKNITETFEVGKKYAIVGENGSGKTTFIKLLTRLYEPTEGRIKMNKIDSKKYDLREYFNLFGVVFQDYHLVGFSLGQNVSVSPTYDNDRVMTTLDKVGLGGFVRNLPNQLDTFLGTEFDDSGVNISGGQEQKLAIARSLYKDAPIMILDEPTAALDPLTEFEIYQNFDNLVEDKTAFYISHRLSSSKFCDEILVFDKGEIIQRGSHSNLVKEEGKYQELWSAQAQYYQ
ncbi:ABC transporter ATP-binding protein [Alkalibacterium olivapovliticus]|uniref:ATP-binding cassette subfamily B protein n=1 Tax=Alkalibacterium olivapovliticus TaxID=99907 RepID=A0A2T0VUV8_9LACT|nr:ABC transporter ATP-binding protein [Alkalibacterium olivapovliticus]PRY75395.1 ATP-binding cassette subfamily B protein [Alkalibacterium olivapovliticus]